MVATSPVRHEPPSNMAPNPIDVQAFQAPWKTLGDYGMGPLGPPDMEHPHGPAPFQQLVSSFAESPLSDDYSVTSLDDDAVTSSTRQRRQVLSFLILRLMQLKLKGLILLP